MTGRSNNVGGVLPHKRLPLENRDKLTILINPDHILTAIITFLQLILLEATLPLKKVGSLAIVPCSREAMPMWSVALIVVGLVIVVGVIVVLIFKRKRRSHESVPTIDQTI
eukprot:GFUD01003994.1.p1 GENE.GFUD01003994.1~~GFUD01003994.1.p1  ORF type:complete len:111 (+),score=13.31 GFUD01003994.1:251-583(+)